MQKLISIYGTQMNTEQGNGDTDTCSRRLLIMR